MSQTFTDEHEKMVNKMLNLAKNDEEAFLPPTALLHVVCLEAESCSVQTAVNVFAPVENFSVKKKRAHIFRSVDNHSGPENTCKFLSAWTITATKKQTSA